jgi:hypothetical protein
MCVAGFFGFSALSPTDCAGSVVAAGWRCFRCFISGFGFEGAILDDAVLGDRRSCAVGVGVGGFLLWLDEAEEVGRYAEGASWSIAFLLEMNNITNKD